VNTVDCRKNSPEARLKEQMTQNLGNLTVVDNSSTAIQSPFNGLQFKLTLASVWGLWAWIAILSSRPPKARSAS
jgi:hypothetical protein